MVVVGGGEVVGVVVGGGDVGGVVVGGGLVGGGLVGAGVLFGAGLAGADVGRVVVDEDELWFCGDVVGTVETGPEDTTVLSRVPLVWTVNQLFSKPCPPACDVVWSPEKKYRACPCMATWSFPLDRWIVPRPEM